jgi:hypothetical protein
MDGITIPTEFAASSTEVPSGTDISMLFIFKLIISKLLVAEYLVLSTKLDYLVTTAFTGQICLQISHLMHFSMST